MQVGILGTGDVGRSLGDAFLALGHQVMMGSRTQEKARAWAETKGGAASGGTFGDAAAFGEWIVLATLGAANEEALRMARPQNLQGKILIDTTNPLDFSAGMPPRLLLSGNDSGGEQVQRLAPGARVVKAFNTVGNALMFRPNLPGGPPTMFICGNSDEAKKDTSALLHDFGWESLDCGGIEMSRHLEAMCIVWVSTAIPTNSWNQAFKMLRG